MKHPALFLGHGSPMNAVEDNPFTRRLRRLGQALAEAGAAPSAVLAVSAHWETRSRVAGDSAEAISASSDAAGTLVLAAERPRTIHDFGGFPQELFDVRYPAPGSPALARRVRELAGGDAVGETLEWGFDHGVWSTLRHLFPEADVPVVPLSLDRGKTPRQHLELARSLAPLREEGVLLVASGNVVHNLSRIDWRQDAPSQPWAESFDGYVKQALLARDAEALVSYPAAAGAALAVPTPEHYVPLLYAFGVSDDSDPVTFLYEGLEMGTLSMRSVRFG